MKTFDEAGRELAEKYATNDGLHSTIKEADFFAGRDSCKDALRAACHIIENAEAFARAGTLGLMVRATIAQFKHSGYYVPEE